MGEQWQRRVYKIDICRLIHVLFVSVCVFVHNTFVFFEETLEQLRTSCWGGGDVDVVGS